MTTNDMKLGPDLDALCRAIAIARRDPSRAEQIDGFVAMGRHKDEIATFCAYCCQVESLQLKPWQVAPCEIPDDDDDLRIPVPDFQHYRIARDLKRKLIRAGLSKWEPDPIAALERTKSRKGFGAEPRRT